MSKKIDNDKLPESLVEIELKQQADAEWDISPGFQVVIIGLVAYIFNDSKLLMFTWLHRVSIVLIATGFVILMIETLKKIRIHRK
ncbi:hypothetical protein GW781_03665 [bacterium]|nr:hypothetical protein [bacterium]NCT20232.1 hypothetical protein [bacterium]